MIRLYRWLFFRRRLAASARRERQRAEWQRIVSGEGLPPKVRAWLDTL